MKTKTKTKTKTRAKRVTGLLVQTIIPKRVADWMKGRAAKEGLSNAAWVRRLIQEKERGSKGLDQRLDKVEERIRRVEMAIVRVARGGSFHEPSCPAVNADATLSDCVCWIAVTCEGCGRVIGEDLGHRPDCTNRRPKQPD